MSKNWRMAKMAAVAAVVAVVLCGGGAAGASATARSHHGFPSIFGTVAAITSGETGTCGTAATPGAFTLTSHSTTYTVDVGATSTTFKEYGVTSATFANVCVNDLAAVTGTVSGTTVTATGVFVTPPPTPHHSSRRS